MSKNSEKDPVVEQQAHNPLTAIDLSEEEYEDDSPEEITDPEHPDYVEPAFGIEAIEGDE